MSDSDYEEETPKKGKRKRDELLKRLKQSRVTAKEVSHFVGFYELFVSWEEFLRMRERNKTNALFSISPCDIKEEDFSLRYGLITEDLRMPAYDRFRLVEVSDDTMACINSLVARDVLYSTEFQGSGWGEQAVAPILDRVARDMGRFTRPRPAQEAETLFPADPQKGKFDLSIQVACEPLSVDNLEDESDNLLINSDIKLFVYKHRNALKGLRLKVINHWKTSASFNNLYQPAMYAIDELKATADYPKAYRPPLYLMTQDINHWFYAIIEIDGYVLVENGAITVESLAAFPEDPEVVDSSRFTPSLSRKQVLEQFGNWNDRMKRGDMFIPNGLHPVGRLFMRRGPSQGYGVPSLGAEQALLSGQKRYYAGLLKVLVGRRVIQWSPDDALNAWSARKCLEEQAMKTSGLREDLWQKVLHS